MQRNILDQATEAAGLIALHLREVNKHRVRTGYTPSAKEMARLSRMLGKALQLATKLTEESNQVKTSKSRTSAKLLN
jgi:hypothetical protein